MSPDPYSAILPVWLVLLVGVVLLAGVFLLVGAKRPARKRVREPQHQERRVENYLYPNVVPLRSVSRKGTRPDGSGRGA